MTSSLAGQRAVCQPSAALGQLLDALDRHRPQTVRAGGYAHTLAGLAALGIAAQGPADAGVLGFFWSSIFSHGTIFNVREQPDVPGRSGLLPPCADSRYAAAPDVALAAAVAKSYAGDAEHHRDIG